MPCKAMGSRCGKEQPERLLRANPLFPRRHYIRPRARRKPSRPGSLMTCEIHQKISNLEQSETNLKVALKVLRARRRHLETTLAYLAEPVPSELIFLSEDTPEIALSMGYDPDNLPQIPSAEPAPSKKGSSREYLSVAVMLASRNDGRVHVADVAREIKSRGLSSAKHSSLSATVHKTLSQSDTWELSEHGTFEFLG